MERPSLNEARGLVTQFIINASYKWPNEKYSFIGMPQSEPWVSSCPADCSIQPFSTAIVPEHLGSTISKVFGAVDGWIHFTWGVGGWPYPMVNPRVEWEPLARLGNAPLILLASRSATLSLATPFAWRRVKSGGRVWRKLDELRWCMNLLGIYRMDMRLFFVEVWV